MRYNILLAGSLQSAIEDIFVHMDEDFRCITSSLRYKDIVRHVRVFKPDMFILCLKDEPREVISTIIRAKKEMEKNDVPFAILGDEEDCIEFIRGAGHMADLILVRPLSNSKILEEVNKFMKKREDEKRRIEEQLEEERQEAARQAEEKEASRQKHILVVDDDSNMLKTIKRQLEPKYEVATALNGSLALRFLAKKTTDLILLDYEMPGENGAEVLADLRANERTKHLPVVFLTGVSEKDRIYQVLQLNPQGYLLKPIDRQKLLDIVEKLIG